MYNNDELDYTRRARQSLHDVVNSNYFCDRDADLIYEALENSVRSLSFGDYLKRYIYLKAEIDMPFKEVPLKEYQLIIRDSFSENSTPPSFEPTTAKLSALSKNWLTQKSVKRSVVFLLGFGLRMSVEDVNEFLVKGLKEQEINAKDPFEVICWYCYKCGYSYPRFAKLYDIYQKTPKDSVDVSLLYAEVTIGARKNMVAINDDTALMAYLTKLKAQDGKTALSVSARMYFDRLYRKAKEIAAGLYNETEAERHEMKAEEYRRSLENSDRFTDGEKRDRVNRFRDNFHPITADDISEADIEKIICSAVPTDRHGNLTPAKASRLNSQFSGKRFSRQRIHDILTGKSEVSRFDLITLNFFIFSQTFSDSEDRKSRYIRFLDSTNSILSDCCLGNVYIANPYENFILMCVLSEDPMGTYADVWEMSYSEL